MKNKENIIVKIYTQADNKKIAISMIANKKDTYGRLNGKPDADAVSVFGDVAGVVVSLWGKLPVVLVSIEQFNKLAKQYEIIEYAGPVTGSGVREKKPRPDTRALRLYKAFSDAAAVGYTEYKILEVDGYRFNARNAADMLSRLKSAFQFTAADIAAALALVLETPADAETAEQPAPVFDNPAPAVEVAADAAPLVQAAKDTGHLIICSVPKAEQPADDTPAPSSEKTEITPVNQKTAADDFVETGAYPIWYNTELECTSGNGVDFKVVSWGRKQVKVEYDDGQRRIFKVRDFINSVERGYIIVSAPYDCEYMAILKRKQQPNEQQAASDTFADADVLAAAARIKASYDAMQADIEADKQRAADMFADAITAYCNELSKPSAPAWMPEVIILKEQPAADTTPAPMPRLRHRLNIAPRLVRWMHPARWVAVVFVVCLLSGLLLGMNTSTAADAAADDIAAVYELHPVTVTAAAVTDTPAAPSPVKKLVTPPPVKKAAADAVTPAGQKTASDMAAADAPAADDAESLTTAPAAPMAPATDADGLTICAGTAWAYTMMNWA